MNKRDYTVLGLMSGTSCDGLDMMLCRIFFEQKWNYEIINFKTVSYSKEETDVLKRLSGLQANELMEMHSQWGDFFGKKAKEFLESNRDIKVDFIASHGHTVYHQPQKGFTFQMGLGANIAVQTQLPVVCDFRTTDIAWKGQGAPLVPIGDEMLFGDFDFCINLGGFVNVSYSLNNVRYAFDVCPMNIVLNEYASILGATFDKDGQWAKSGRIHLDCLDELNELEYYKLPPPKSLGIEWVKTNVNPILRRYDLTPQDALATFVEHSVTQLAAVLKGWVGQSLLTGGGSYNDFFIERLRSKIEGMELLLPEENLINGKEALIFALLGVLRWENNYNSIHSVTGATRSSTGGAIYLY